MKDLIEKALSAIIGWIGELLNTIIEFLLMEWLAPNVTKNLETGISLYNGIIGNAVDILLMTPAEWNDDGWMFIIEEVYPVFLVVACPLIVIFWLYNLSKETIDPRMTGNLRMETLLFAFFKLSIAEFVTVFSPFIIWGGFGFIDLLTGGWISRNAGISSGLGFTEAQVRRLPGLILAITYLLSLICIAVYIIVPCIISYTATVRMYKIIVAAPFGTLSSSTITGSREMSHTAMSFWKFIIHVILEGVMILLVLALFAQMQSSLVIIDLDGNLDIMGKILNRIMVAFLCLGGVKGADTALQKFGL